MLKSIAQYAFLVLYIFIYFRLVVFFEISNCFLMEKDSYLLIYNNFIVKKANKQTKQKEQYCTDNIKCIWLYIFLMTTEEQCKHCRVENLCFDWTICYCFCFCSLFFFCLFLFVFFFLWRIKLKAPFTIWSGRKLVFTGKSSLDDLIGYNTFGYESLEHIFWVNISPCVYHKL